MWKADRTALKVILIFTLFECFSSNFKNAANMLLDTLLIKYILFDSTIRLKEG